MLSDARRIVVKVGSSLMIGEDNRVREAWLASLAQDIVQLRKGGKEVIIVTSGAVGLGRDVMGYGKRALELEEKQAAAACGQIMLFQAWAMALASEHLSAAQILLTADDSINRRRYLNARATLEKLLEHGKVIPVINENDTVATAELRFGDNDRLAARVAQMVGADMLVLFSDIEGLYSADPRHDKNATFIERVEDITDAIEAMAGGVGSSVGSGGMVTKLQAAKIATAAGCHMMIAKGVEHHPLMALQKDGKHTFFVAKGTPMSARKHWIAGSLHPTGTLVVDDGAAVALKSGKSLLPAGVRAIEGQFERGDAVLVKNAKGVIIGRGLSAYNASDAAKIIGHKSSEIEEILGFKGRAALIHRDDLVLG